MSNILIAPKTAGEKYGLAGEFQLLKFEGFLTPYINYFGHPKEVMKPTPKKEYQKLAEKYKGEYLPWIEAQMGPFVWPVPAPPAAKKTAAKPAEKKQLTLKIV
jgi:hypothetical protein